MVLKKLYGRAKAAASAKFADIQEQRREDARFRKMEREEIRDIKRRARKDERIARAKKSRSFRSQASSFASGLVKDLQKPSGKKKKRRLVKEIRGSSSLRPKVRP